MRSDKCIKVVGARQNNLKDLALDLPREQLIAITGVSGSGKSSLALDTLYAEGQRRYVETFSPYARQFLDRLDRPQVEAIVGIPPAIAIEQGNRIKSSRSTVGTITELADHLKLLFARAAILHCQQCGRPVYQDTPETIWSSLSKIPEESPVLIIFPLAIKGRTTEEAHGYLWRQGFRRLWHQQKVLHLDDEPIPDEEYLDVLVDRTVWSQENRKRILDSMEQAYHFGEGQVTVIFPPAERHLFSATNHCAFCDMSYPSASPHLFSFNSPLGACETCRGFGRAIDVDLDLVIPDQRLTLEEGAIKPWSTERMEYYDLMDFCDAVGVPTDVSFNKLSPAQQEAVIEESDEFYGVRGFFNWLETKTYKMHVRVFLSRYRAYRTCAACNGSRFKPLSLLYRVGGKNIAEINQLPISRVLIFFLDMAAIFEADPASKLVFREIIGRLTYLSEVGLGYLSLDRQSRSLSGGEVQRVHLTRALGSPLVNTLYVLDEPSVGLHPRDNRRLVRILRALTRQRNTVVVVEHDPEIIRASDYLVDLGPGAGERGGKAVFAGPSSEISAAKSSRTGAYITGSSRPARPTQRRRPGKKQWLDLVGIQAHNLRTLDVRIPMGLLVAVTGVSGSGKSTLVEDVLYRNWLRRQGLATETPGYCREIKGLEYIDDVVFMDQQAIGRSPRANLLTYSGALTPIRELFAKTDLARLRNYGPGHFSFNTTGGRCEACAGQGFEKVEMQFLADLYLECAVCKGRRFREEILEVSYRGFSIGQVMDLTLAEAMELFADQNRIIKPLSPLRDVGLDYLRLGQPVSTLSGGESQRLKLARSLGIRARTNTLIILDEPTTGLHADDTRLLVKTLNRLVDAGNSMVVVEHNLDVIQAADHVIDLGPEGGDEGGEVVIAGTPEEIAESSASHTGRFLARYWQGFETAAPVADMNGGPEQNGAIKIRGAREHNLRDLTLDVPRDQLVVVTGVSGSGKSTLAFNVLFAEGQRRYLDSLSTFARQYLPVFDRPEAEEISGVPPTVAIDQRSSQMGRRSTVATITEVYHYLRLLFSKVGKPHCPICGQIISAMSPEQMTRDLRQRFEHKRLILLAPKIMGRKGFHRQILERAVAQGYEEARIDGKIYSLNPIPKLARFREHDVEIVIGKWKRFSKDGEVELAGVVDETLAVGDGQLVAWGGKKNEVFYSRRLTCGRCHLGMPSLDPRLFSFNSRHGACDRCEGIGHWGGAVDRDVCPVCKGARLNETALSVRINGRNIWDVCDQSVSTARGLFTTWQFSGRDGDIAKPLLDEILNRLDFLEQVGLDYLHLGRGADTLSGGEAQRIRLAAQMGSNLRGVCYILDEPTIGLHPRDNDKLLDTLAELKEKGNTIVVVEHDEETIRRADHLIDLGPGAGRHGGGLVASGTLADLKQTPQSITGAYLNGRGRRNLTSQERKSSADSWLMLSGARARNLKNIDVSVPLGTFTCVTGVSGSGKSTLVEETLYKALANKLSKAEFQAGEHQELAGWKHLDRVMEVDHSPIGRTPRSVPVTYVKVFNDIRRLFSLTPEARARGYGPGRFSFNVATGRCQNCKGQGLVRVEMAFLPNVYVRCEQCNGQRYNSETLAVRYKGKNIAEVLEMSLEEAADFFGAVAKIKRALQLLVDLGLGYLSMGQSSPTLSGGEAQRLKLANELAKNHQARTLYILDEPTTGLHIADVEKLVAVLQALVDHGHTLVVIEHNLEVIKAADYIIDLGPEGGDGGGKVVACGSPRELLEQTERSYTARYLKSYLEDGDGA
ncbi:MAG: excinuclease ABC subunit UvrA [Syntrophobacteria bacterium]